MRMRRAVAVPAVALAAIAGAVSLGGCDGPFMMSDDKAETTQPAPAHSVKDGSNDGGEMHGSSGERME
jgi:hypothetical protein